MSIYGYCRISTAKQSIDRQVRNIKAEYPTAHIVQEAYTGTSIFRPEWLKLYRVLKAGDTSIKKSVLFVPLNEKWLLTIPEAAAYFGVGQNRISELALQDGCKFVVFVGAKKLIKRKKFEEFLDEQYAI